MVADVVDDGRRKKEMTSVVRVSRTGREAAIKHMYSYTP
jgi:hypothetical protein